TRSRSTCCCCTCSGSRTRPSGCSSAPTTARCTGCGESTVAGRCWRSTTAPTSPTSAPTNSQRRLTFAATDARSARREALVEQPVAQRLRERRRREQPGARDHRRDEQPARPVEVRRQDHPDHQRQQQPDEKRPALRRRRENLAFDVPHKTVSSVTTTFDAGTSTARETPVTSPGFFEIASPSLSTRAVTITLPCSLVPDTIASRASSVKLSGHLPAFIFFTARTGPGCPDASAPRATKKITSPSATF